MVSVGMFLNHPNVCVDGLGVEEDQRSWRCQDFFMRVFGLGDLLGA